MSSVQLKDVHKHYGKVKAVNGISFECRYQEFLVILGPSGAGKTSTLKMIAGLEPITLGEIFVGKRLINFIPPEKRNVAMVFESYALYPHLTVYENIAFPLQSKNSRLSKVESNKRVHETAELLQIGPLLERKPAELSGGQKQRVSLGRALAKRTELLLMDEPLSHLDAKLRHHMRRELKKYQRMLDTTVIYVTHDYLEGLALADRIVILNEGRIHQIGTPSEVYNNPSDTFVASLIGQPKINLIPCQVQGRHDAQLLLLSKDGTFRVPCPLSTKKLPQKNDRVMVGVRPQYLHLSKNLEKPGMVGEVYVSENLGVKCIVEVKVGQQRLKALTERQDYAIGQPVKIDVPKNSIMLFEPQLGKNLLMN
ncbi:MAG: ABC transporter ATP-binding protein [bacterium]